MLYRAYQFDGLTLPTAYGASGYFDIAPGTTPNDWVTLAGGRAWNARRTDRARPGMVGFGMQSALEGANEAAIRTAYDALAAKWGISGVLSRIDAAGATQTLTAVLTSVETQGSPGHGLRFQPVTLTFETASLPWKGTSRTGSASPITNSGNAPYTPVVWTITAGGGAACTAVDFLAGPDANGRIWHWHWTGTVAATKSLVIDCGAMTVKNDGANAYSTFVPQSNHNQDYWTEAPVGTLTYSMTLTGAGATHSYQSYDGWY